MVKLTGELGRLTFAKDAPLPTFFLILQPCGEKTRKECASKLELHYITARFNFGGGSSSVWKEERRGKEGKEARSRGNERCCVQSTVGRPRRERKGKGKFELPTTEKSLGSDAFHPGFFTAAYILK